MNKFISYATAFLVFMLGIGSFILSYNALRGVAFDNGLPEELSYIWPLLVDFALIVFSLAVVQSNLNNEPTAWRWAMVGLYTVATVAFNVYHAPANLAAQIVAVVAPVSLFLSFETLMSMLRKSVQKKAAILSLAQITAKLKELEGLYRGQKDNLESELDSARRERLAEIEREANQISQEAEANRLELANQISQLESEQARLTEEATAKAKALDSYRQDIEAKREELKALDVSQSKIYVPANLSIEQRRELVNRMSQEGLTIEAIASALNCSPGTVKNDKAAIRAIVEPADLPGTIARNGNGHAGKG